LQAKRSQIIADDALWEMSAEFKAAASARMKSLVCPSSYYSHTRNLFEFTGSWDTILWQHFVERWGSYALFGSVDPARYDIVVEIFAVFTELAADGQSRNQLRELKVRALAMLSKFEEIGPLQEHTSVYHLIIELIIQAMRWGPPSAVWCYFLERFIGHLVRGIKSKRHAEANIMSRFRNTLIPCRAFQNPRFKSLVPMLSQSTNSIIIQPSDKFLTRARNGVYTLLANDHEDLHAIFIELHIIYKRAARECVWAHDNRIDSPGHTFQKSKPWLEPTYPESAVWQQRNSISLSGVVHVEAFKFDNVKRAHNELWRLPFGRPTNGLQD
jgi:hypothetical protein